MKRTFQYVRMASQRRLFSFAVALDNAKVLEEQEDALGEPTPQFDHSHLVVEEGHVLRRRIADAEYDDF